jgi:hypothetical protein
MRLWSAALLICGALLSGCSVLNRDDEVAEPTPTTTDGAATAPPVAPPTPTGLPLQTFQLETGQCFNTYDEPVTQAGAAAGSTTTSVPCTGPHGHEVIAILDRPEQVGNEPYPGTTDLNQWGQAECYKLFPSYVGIDYELSVYEIGQFVPTEEQWLQGLYRKVHCYIYIPEQETTGTARNVQR